MTSRDDWNADRNYLNDTRGLMISGLNNSKNCHIPGHREPPPPNQLCHTRIVYGSAHIMLGADRRTNNREIHLVGCHTDVDCSIYSAVPFSGVYESNVAVERCPEICARRLSLFCFAAVVALLRSRHLSLLVVRCGRSGPAQMSNSPRLASLVSSARICLVSFHTHHGLLAVARRCEVR